MILNKILLVLVVVLAFVVGWHGSKVINEKEVLEPANVLSPFIYSFNTEGKLQEAEKPSKSTSPYWWLNSGGVMDISEGKGATNQGNLPAISSWKILYNLSNPTDTDSGLRPQNIFRLVTRSKWQNFTEEVYFKINRLNLSESPNRNLSNGLLLFLRYQDGNNLYYAGVRVDGLAVIKKKIHGKYFTLAQEKIFEGNYDRLTNPNLLPKNVWLGLRSEISDQEGQVNIKLFIDEKNTGLYKLVLETKDTNGGIDGGPISREGFAGIRTDFMDVEFKDFKITVI